MIDIDLLTDTDNKVKINLGDSHSFLCDLESESVNLIITSPPYCIGKEYEDLKDDEKSFIASHESILPEAIRILKHGGSLCWQVGYHVKNSNIIPLDILIYNIIEEINKSLALNERMRLRNRIIWTFGHGLHSSKRLSGRHETILWFTKGDTYTFNLDEIRIPQKYPGKTHHKGEKKGQLSGNPLGKNPSDVWIESIEDVWDIPNVKSKHPEKTIHPCQFPSAIPNRLIKALTNEGDIVLDPFMGSGTTGVAAMMNKRYFIGGELDDNYFQVAKNRIFKAYHGIVKVRPDTPVEYPSENLKVSKKPDHFK